MPLVFSNGQSNLSLNSNDNIFSRHNPKSHSFRPWELLYTPDFQKRVKKLGMWRERLGHAPMGLSLVTLKTSQI